LDLSIPVASAHAYLLRSDPPANVVLNAPPQMVRLWFSENLNPFTSHAIIVDTTNHEVDTSQGTVNSSNAMEVDVTPLLLRAGTYVVVWRSQSAQDGHITGGSFLFRIARPDGSIPPVPNVLPTGHFPGAAGSGLSANATLDGPAIVQTLMTWLALLGMTVWVGGLCWETWILPPTKRCDPDVAVVSRQARRRFRYLAFSALILVLFSDIGIVLGQAAELAGAWSGSFSLPIVRAVLFGSYFGTVWWLRQGIALLALLVLLLARRSNRSKRYKQISRKNRETGEASFHSEMGTIPNWWSIVLQTFIQLIALPYHLVAGWRARSRIGRLEVLLGGALILAFALSGHAAAVPSSQLAYALSIDLLHLICTATWVGGLLYLGVVFVPVLSSLTRVQQARVIALGLPEFSAAAIVSVLILASTGFLNTTIHVTAPVQLLTTLYGRILTIKIMLFLAMVCMSTYHAFFLRTRLVRALTQSPVQPTAMASSSPTAKGKVSRADKQDNQEGTSLHYRAQVNIFTRNIVQWVQREAIIGSAILLCVAFLGASAGTLAPTSPTTATKTGQASGPFLQTQSVQGYRVTLKVAPDTFGTNTFTVTVADIQGHPVQGAAVLAEITMLDMDMGTDALQLPAVPTSAGTFNGQGELTMAGHWQVRLRILPPKKKTFVMLVFSFATR
jgi:putative copper export protein/methionine-rich copper-binding protein CopC